MTPKSDIADRISAALATQSSTRTVPMFGGVSFMVDDKMVVAARGDGALLVRADPARNRELVGLPGAGIAEMGGRVMSPSWISVAADAIVDDDRLAFWIDVALEYNRRTRKGNRNG